MDEYTKTHSSTKATFCINNHYTLLSSTMPLCTSKSCTKFLPIVSFFGDDFGGQDVGILNGNLHLEFV